MPCFLSKIQECPEIRQFSCLFFQNLSNCQVLVEIIDIRIDQTKFYVP
jgi:hypothetical protein